MRKTLMAAAALGLLAGAPMIANAADVGTSPTVVAANAPAPAYSGPFHRWFARQKNASAATRYGDPQDPGRAKADQVIIAPVGP